MSDYQRAVSWYERLLASEPAFLPNATEAVWEVAEHRYLHVKELPERAGFALHTLFVDNLDERIESIGARGIEPGRLTRLTRPDRGRVRVPPSGRSQVTVRASACASLRRGCWR